MAELRGRLVENEPMAGHVSWRAGGPVARAYFPADLADLAQFLHRLRPDEPLLCVGLGSNLLVRAGGFDGTMVFTHAALNVLRQEPDGTLYVEAGVASPKVARFAASLNLVGVEFLAGIPGTFGGALAMNAGCYGGETWQFVERALMLNRGGELVERQGGNRRDLCRGLAAPARRRRCGGARAHCPAAGTAHGEPAARPSECRFGIPESARRSCRAPDRGGRPQGACRGGRAGVRKAREFHR
jgi:hypothetical protein